MPDLFNKGHLPKQELSLAPLCLSRSSDRLLCLDFALPAFSEDVIPALQDWSTYAKHLEMQSWLDSYFWQHISHSKCVQGTYYLLKVTWKWLSNYSMLGRGNWCILGGWRELCLEYCVKAFFKMLDFLTHGGGGMFGFKSSRFGQSPCFVLERRTLVQACLSAPTP